MFALYLWPAWVPKRRPAVSYDAPELQRSPPRKLGFFFDGFTPPVVTDFDTMRRLRDPVPFAPSWRPEQKPRILGGLIQAIDEDLERQKPKKYVPLEPRARSRDLEHQQLTRSILNALLRSGELVMEGQDVYAWGYVPANRSDWSPPAPATVGEAIDRLAVLFKALQGGNGA